jgi:hypothetical protein
MKENVNGIMLPQLQQEKEIETALAAKDIQQSALRSQIEQCMYPSLLFGLF